MADESSARPEVVSVWEKVKSQTFDHIPFRANVMDAFHAAVPIAIDGDIFVVGFSAAQFHMSGLLRTPDTKNAAESVLRDMAKREIQLEVIEGTTVEEWRSIKERRTISRESQMRDARVRLDNRSTKGSFDSLREELARRHSEVEGRQFPQAKARFLRDVLLFSPKRPQISKPIRRSTKTRSTASWLELMTASVVGWICLRRTWPSSWTGTLPRNRDRIRALFAGSKRRGMNIFFKSHVTAK